MNERLKEWAIHHLKHRNIFMRNLIDIKDNSRGFIANFKNKYEEYIINDNLDFENLNKENNTVLVCMNTNKNFQKLISEWKVIIGFGKLKIMFVDKINSNKYWQIIPSQHDKIADKKSLKSGLKSLYEGVKH